MKFLIEVLEEWPEEAKRRGGFTHTDITDSKIHMVVHPGDKLVTGAVFQAPFLDEIPSMSLLRITKIN